MKHFYTSISALLLLVGTSDQLYAQNKSAATLNRPVNPPTQAAAPASLPYVKGSLWSPPTAGEPVPQATSLYKLLSDQRPHSPSVGQAASPNSLISSSAFAQNPGTAASVNIERVKLAAAARNLSAEDLVATVLAELTPDQLRLRNAAEELELYNDQTDGYGVRHLRLQQVYQGIPVYGGEVIVHVTEAGATSVNGRLQPSLKSFDTTPSLLMADAEEVAYAHVGPRVDYRANAAAAAAHPEDEEPTLMIFFGHDGSPQLAYRTVAHPNLAQRIELMVDARDGRILRELDQICHAFDHTRFDLTASPSASSGQADKTGINLAPTIGHASNGAAGTERAVWFGPRTGQGTDLNGRSRTLQVFENPEAHYLIDVTRPMFQGSSTVPGGIVGGIVTNDAQNTYPGDAFRAVYTSSGNNSWTDRGTVSAHYNSEVSYEYFRQTFGRNPIDGVGGTVISFANTADENGGNMDNAFWNGRAMFYGNGNGAFSPLAGSLDVGGHEMSHGVVQETAGLEYEGESGALNESFADIFGAMIDRDDWTIGEEIVNRGVFPSGALRSLQDPHNGGSSLNDNGYQPSHYNERYTGTEDHGGVHINSGIPNRAFFLIATAIGREKAEQLFYTTLTNFLTRTSQFVDLRNGVQQATEQRFGRGGAEWNAVVTAFDAVGMPGSAGGGGGGTGPTDQPVNPGDELVVFTDAAEQVVRLANASGNLIFSDITPSAVPLSRPSVSDDGSQVVLVTSTGRLNQIFVDYRTNTFSENLIDFDIDSDGTSDLRNAAISRDGRRLALLTDLQDEYLYVLDIPSGVSGAFRLYTPGSNGERVHTIDYADVMEWDYSGQAIVFDAQNTVAGNGGLSYMNWDIGVLDAFAAPTGGALAQGEIVKIFGALTEGTSVGNPTLAKNSEYIMSLDYIGEGDEYAVLAIDLETGNENTIYQGDKLGWPTYSASDRRLFFSASDNNDEAVLGVVDLGADKISVPSGQAFLFAADAARSTAFANGSRVISNLADILSGADWVVAPNPTKSEAKILRRDGAQPSEAAFEVFDVRGARVLSAPASSTTLDVSVLPKGAYVVKQGEKSQVLVKD